MVQGYINLLRHKPVRNLINQNLPRHQLQLAFSVQISDAKGLQRKPEEGKFEKIYKKKRKRKRFAYLSVRGPIRRKNWRGVAGFTGTQLLDSSRWRHRHELCDLPFISVTSWTPIVPKLLSNNRPGLQQNSMTTEAVKGNRVEDDSKTNV